MPTAFTLLLPLLLVACPGARRGPIDEPAAAGERTERKLPTTRTVEIRTWYLRAATAEARGDFDEAERSLNWVRRFDDATSPWPDVAMGRLYENIGRWEDAISSYQDALQRDERCRDAHLGLGRAMVTRKLDAGARPHLERAAELQSDAEVLELLGRLYVREKEVEASLVVLDRWMENETSRAEALRQARLARQIGCDAMERMERVVSAWDFAPDVLREGAAAYDGCGMSERANTLRQRADTLEAVP